MAAILLALVGAGALVALGDLRLAAWPAIGVLVAWGLGVVALPRPRWGVGAVLAAAVAVRAILLASPASLSDDLFRYLWEGQAVLLGGNPYLDPPSSDLWGALAPADPWRGSVNHPDVPSIYPPAALWLFALISRAWHDPMAIKLVMGLCDALVAWAIAGALLARGRRLDAAWLYALHPLGAVEAAGSGHLEAVALLFMVLAVRAWDRGGSGVGWAALGGGVKLLPAVIVPVLWRRRPWLLALVLVLIALTAWPFLDAGERLVEGLSTYARHWSFNASLFAVIEAVTGSWARYVAVSLGALVALGALWRRGDPAVVALWVGGAFVLLSPTVHPWYVAWAWAPALLVGVRAWTVLATLVPLSYAALASYDPATSSWTEPVWPAWVMYVPFFAALAWEWARHQVRPGPWAADARG